MRDGSNGFAWGLIVAEVVALAIVAALVFARGPW